MIAPDALRLPQPNGSLAAFRPHAVDVYPVGARPLAQRRTAFAAAHVVCDPLAPDAPATRVDWDATLSYRRLLWRLGFGVAEAMDTAQRGMGLTWDNARELVRRSAREAAACGGRIASGAGTDDLDPAHAHSLDAIERAYLDQCAYVEGCGSQIILMASQALVRGARSPEDYARVYARVLGQVREPVIVHWLGAAFDPQLAGYWGSADLDAATETCVEILTRHAEHVDGIKISLLDAQREIDLRRRLPAGVRMYTGDDFNYPALIAGDELGYSDALLSIFDAIAPAAAAALDALDRDDRAAYDRIFAPTLALSRHIFASPTSAYKTGIVFLAYLNGHQSHFRMLAGAESARSVVHLARLFELAYAAGLIVDVERAAQRMRRFLALAGIV